MTLRAGVDIGHDRIRAVTLSGRSPRVSFEIGWDERAPRDAVALLAKKLGRVDSVCLSIGLAFMHVKHVNLPPVSAAERRSILTLEPDRFFVTDSQDVLVSTLGDSDLVFAAERSRIDELIRAFETWAPVVVIDPAPYALARALRAGKMRSGEFGVSADENDCAIVEIQSDRVTDVRRATSDATGKAKQPGPVDGVAPEFLSAYGAALGADASLDEMLLPPEMRKRAANQRRMNLVRAGFNLALALIFLIAAADRSRSRVLDSEEQEIAALTPKAAGPASIQAHLARLDLERAEAASSNAAEAVSVIAAISARLPRDATVMSLTSAGNEWQINGTASHAAAIIPALSSDSLFENVRSLTASSRFDQGGRTFETFSVALHAKH